MSVPTLTVTSPLAGSNINPTIVAYGKCNGMNANSVISCSVLKVGSDTPIVVNATLYSNNTMWKVTIISGLNNGDVVNITISSAGALPVSVNNLTINGATPIGTPPPG